MPSFTSLLCSKPTLTYQTNSQQSRLKWSARASGALLASSPPFSCGQMLTHEPFASLPLLLFVLHLWRASGAAGRRSQRTKPYAPGGSSVTLLDKKIHPPRIMSIHLFAAKFHVFAALLRRRHTSIDRFAPSLFTNITREIFREKRIASVLRCGPRAAPLILSKDYGINASPRTSLSFIPFAFGKTSQLRDGKLSFFKLDFLIMKAIKINANYKAEFLKGIFIFGCTTSISSTKRRNEISIELKIHPG